MGPSQAAKAPGARPERGAAAPKRALLEEEDDEEGGRAAPRAGAAAAAAAAAAASSSSGRRRRQEGSDADSDAESDEDAGAGFNINKAFAKKFEAKNRRDDLFRARERGLLDDSEEDDSEEGSEDDNGKALTAKKDLDIMRTIALIRAKDKRIYDGSFKAFADEEEEDADEQGRQEDAPAGSKPLTYKDMVRERAMKKLAGDEDAADSGSESESEVAAPRGSYQSDQAKLKAAFRSSAQAGAGAGSDSEDELIQLKPKGVAEVAQEEDDFARYVASLKAKNDKVVASRKDDVGLVERIFKHEPADKDEAFLRKFFLNEGWVDKYGTGDGSGDESESESEGESEGEGRRGQGDLDDLDEEAEDAADRFEHKYNFRFEEPGGSEIAKHPRRDGSSVRRKEPARKRQREEKKARLKADKLRAQEELRRLKNLRRQELEARVRRTNELAGIAPAGQAGKGAAKAGFTAEDLDGDFDPDEWDRKMAQRFNDDYYAEGDDEEDQELAAGVDKLEEEFGADEDLVGRGRGSGRGSDASPQEHSGEADGESGNKIKKKKKRFGVLVEDEEEDENEGREAPRRDRKPDDPIEEELYKLDYEDIIAGGTIKTRFKYKTVTPNAYGLSIDEILLADDKDLAQFVPLKFMAPYKDEEFTADTKRRRRLRQALKERLTTIKERKHKKKAKEARKLAALNEQRMGKGKDVDGNADEDEDADAGASADANADVDDAPASQPEAPATKKRMRKRSKKNKGAAATDGDESDGDAGANQSVAAQGGRARRQAEAEDDNEDEDVAESKPKEDEEDNAADKREKRKRKRRRQAKSDTTL
jgi:protein KRI1